MFFIAFHADTILVCLLIAANLGLASVQPNNEAVINNVVDPRKTQQNFVNFFESIGKNDTEQRETYRTILEEETRQEQQAFNSMKDEFRSARLRNDNKWSQFSDENGDTDEAGAVHKREVDAEYSEYPEEPEGNSYESAEEDGDLIPIHQPAWYRKKQQVMKKQAHFRFDEETDDYRRTVSDKPTDPDHRDVLFYALGVLSEHRSYINAAQDECDRLVELGYRMKTILKLLDDSEKLLNDARNEIGDKFKLGIFPENLVAPIDNATVNNFSSNIKELKSLLAKRKTSSQKTDQEVEKSYAMMQKYLDTAEENLDRLRIEYHLSRPYNFG